MIDRMTESLRYFEWSLDGWIIVAGVLCAAASALLGGGRGRSTNARAPGSSNLVGDRRRE